MGDSPLHTLLDSGPPTPSSDYTTVVIVHGLCWHAPNFKKLLPLAAKRNARIILLNRRDYPGSKPYTAQEQALLARLVAAPPGTPEAAVEMQDFFRDRARELQNYLVDLVKSKNIPPARGLGKGATGGIVLGGWSFGVTLLTAYLANVDSLSSFGSDVSLSSYLRRIVFYDGSYNFFGYGPPQGVYHPLTDTSLPTFEARVHRFDEWVAGYFEHGFPITPSTLASRHALADPPLSTTSMSAEEIVEMRTNRLGELHANDLLIVQAGVAHGTFEVLKKRALYFEVPTLPSTLQDSGASEREDWSGIEVRYVWCDRSIWEMAWGWQAISKEVEEAKKDGKAVRDVKFVRFRGANHFAHWDYPEKAMEVFLGEESEIV